MKILAFLTMEYPKGGLEKTRETLPKVVPYFLLLKKRGHSITFVMPAQKDTSSGEIEDLGIKVFRMPRTKFVLFNYFAKIKSFKNQDVIFVMDDHWGAIFAVFMKFFFKIPYFHNHDYPMELEGQREHILSGTKINLRSYIRGKIMQAMINFSMRRADVIFATSQLRKERLEKINIPAEKIIVLSPGTDLSLFNDQVSKEAVVEKLKLHGKKIIVCVTTILKFRKPQILIEIAEQLQKHMETFCLLIVGFGNYEDEFKKLIADSSAAEKIIYTGRVPHHEVAQYIACADVALSCIPPDELYIDSAPNKVFEYLAMRKPIVASDIFLHRKLIEETGCGIIVPFTAEAFSRGILKIYAQLSQNKKFIYPNIEELDYEKRVDIMEKIFKDKANQK